MDKSDQKNAVIALELHDILTRKKTQVLGVRGLGLVFVRKGDCGHSQKENQDNHNGLQFALSRIRHEYSFQLNCMRKHFLPEFLPLLSPIGWTGCSVQ